MLSHFPVAACDTRAAPGVGAGTCRGRLRAEHCGPVKGTLDRLLHRSGDDVGVGCVGCVGAVPDFYIAQPPRETENLGNWKPDMLPGVPALQDFRFSGFQVFTPMLPPRIWPGMS